MPLFKVNYVKESKYSMLVKAKDEKEAQEKYEQGDYIEDTELEGLNESVTDIEQVE